MSWGRHRCYGGIVYEIVVTISDLVGTSAFDFRGIGVVLQKQPIDRFLHARHELKFL